MQTGNKQSTCKTNKQTVKWLTNETRKRDKIAERETERVRDRRSETDRKRQGLKGKRKTKQQQ